MAAPKYKQYPAEPVPKPESPSDERETQALEQVHIYIRKINDTLKQPDMARKAALIIEDLLKQK